MATIVVHHLEDSRSHRILWLLEELGLEYDIEMHRRHPKTNRSGKELRAVHPLGKAPIVVVDGEVFAESGAILESLLDRFDPESSLRPAPKTEEHRRYRFFLHYAEGSLMPPLLVKLLMGVLRGKNIPFLARPLSRDRGTSALDLLRPVHSEDAVRCERHLDRSEPECRYLPLSRRSEDSVQTASGLARAHRRRNTCDRFVRMGLSNPLPKRTRTAAPRRLRPS